MDSTTITHILFDLGNVLVALHPVEEGARMCPALSPSNQAPLNIVKDYECGRISTEAFLARAPGALGLPLTDDTFRTRFKSIVGEWYEQTGSLLQALRQHYRLGCLSNTNPLHIEALTERGPHLASLHDCFFSHDIGWMKPEAEAYQHVISAWQVPPDQILFIDDRPENVDGAKASGMQTALARGPEALMAICRRVL